MAEQATESNLDFDDNELHESSITTKIYKSNDNSGEVLDNSESGLDSASDADILSKEDLINRHSKSNGKIIHRKVIKNGIPPEKSVNNIWLPWIMFVVILLVLFTLMKIIRRVKI